MTPDHLRTLFTFPSPDEPAAPNLIPAAVLVPLFFQDGELQVLLTQRTTLVRDHQGQVSFPGGVRSPQDASSLVAALRETQEEIGLEPEAVEVLGALPPISTLTGYCIHSFVGLIPYPYPFRINQHEVARLIPVPVAALLEPARWFTGPFAWQGHLQTVYYCHFEGTFIWGATAVILFELLTRVEPTFRLLDTDDA